MVQPRVVHANLAHHLTYDNLDVLVVDFYTLQAVYLLNLLNQVVLNGDTALDGQDVVGVGMTLGDHVALLQLLTLGDADALTEGNQVALLGGSTVLVHTGNHHMAVLLAVVDVSGTGNLGHDGQSLGRRLSNSSSTRGRPWGDGLAECDTAGMEGTHGQLGTGLTDGLEQR